MRIANKLERQDARRIARHLGMTGDPLALSLLESGPEDARRHNQASCLVVEDMEGKALTKELAHLHFEWLESMPEDLRRKLLQSGHVLVRLDNVRHGSFIAEGGNGTGGMFTFDSPLFGEAAGIGRYTKPEPHIEAIGHSDMSERFSFHRVMPEMYAERNASTALQMLDSDLRLYVDIGSIDAAALNQVPSMLDGR